MVSVGSEFQFISVQVSKFMGIACYSSSAGADAGFCERGGSDKYIHNWGRVREGAYPSRDSKRVWGSADSSPSGVWGEAPAAFLLLRVFSMKFTVISNTNIMRYSDYQSLHG